MKLVKPSFTILEQSAGLEGVYKQIEKMGRVCYKSEDKITEDSAKPFVDRLINSGHTSVLEHGTVYLQIHWNDNNREEFDHIYCDYASNPYSKVVRKIQEDDLCPTLYVTTNYRVLIEHDWLSDLEYLCEPTEYHARRACVHFICDRGILAEFTRHRMFSFSAESTRYCNYSKDKFGNEITYIMPCWIPYKEGKYEIGETEDGWGNYNGDVIERNGEIVYENDPDYKKFLYYFINALDEAETAYFCLLNQGWTPQQARAVLPNALKTELVMTGFVDDWEHFFGLRCASNSHPQAQELAIPLREEFIKRGYINE